MTTLDEIKKYNKNIREDTEHEDITDDELEQNQEDSGEYKKTSIMDNIPESLREPTLIVLIFVLLSFDGVKKLISNYIPQAKQSTDGTLYMTGVFTYAIIMAIIYVVAKKILL